MRRSDDNGRSIAGRFRVRHRGEPELADAPEGEITAAPNVSSLPACMESQNGDAAEGSVARPESISRSSPRRRAEAAV